jgi:uncharacterized protein with von Willebrand factor type A (vWA) domain
VARRVKDFIEISEHTSLDDLIRFLQTIRDTLPPDAEPELKIRGDDIFGRRLTISFLRELTPEEAALEAKYTSAEPEPDPTIEELREKLDKVPYKGTGGRRP